VSCVKVIWKNRGNNWRRKNNREK